MKKCNTKQVWDPKYTAQKIQHRLDNPEVYMFRDARKRARRNNIPFDITPEDIIIPEYCPVLGIKLESQVGKRSDASPSLDKIIPSLGYIVDNIEVISWRANCLKRDATFEELKLLSDYYNR